MHEQQCGTQHSTTQCRQGRECGVCSKGVACIVKRIGTLRTSCLHSFQLGSGTGGGLLLLSSALIENTHKTALLYPYVYTSPVVFC